MTQDSFAAYGVFGSTAHIALATEMNMDLNSRLSRHSRWQWYRFT